jgi:disulfide bond formation protein DsbB
LALGFALVSQYGFGLKPCSLCLFQRVPYVVNILIGLIGFYALKDRPRFAVLAVAAAGAVFLAGAGIAFYHVGVEQHWWVSFLEGCRVNFKTTVDSKDFLAQIMATPAVHCDAVAWSLFGISMAGYNAALSLILSDICLVATMLGLKPKKAQ